MTNKEAIEKLKEILFMTGYKEALDLAIKALEERPQGESTILVDGLKKARHGNYVIYDVDFLLDNLAREVNIMESARRWNGGRSKNL